jgi:hypothetical protein
MSFTGIRLLSVAGVLALLAFFGAGISYLMIPPPPEAIRGPAAASLCLLGVVVLTVTNCISYFLGMMATARNREEAEAISRAMFNVFSNGFAMIKGGAKARTPSRRRRHHGGRSS